MQLFSDVVAMNKVSFSITKWVFSISAMVVQPHLFHPVLVSAPLTPICNNIICYYYERLLFVMILGVVLVARMLT